MNAVVIPNEVDIDHADMSRLVLVKTCYDYSDEFDVKGAILMEAGKLFAHVQALEKYFEDGNGLLEVYFGTNEAIRFSSIDDVTYGIEVADLNVIDAEVLKFYMGEGGFGMPILAWEHI